MDKREDKFEKIQRDLYGDTTASLREDHDPFIEDLTNPKDHNSFIEDLTVPKSKREDFVGGLRVETPIPKPVQKQIQPSIQQPRQNPNTERANPPKRNLKNEAKPSNKKFGRNIGKGLAIGALATALAVSTLIGVKIHENHMNKIYSHDIQSQIEQDMVEELREGLSVNDLDFDGQNFNISAKSHRTELYKVLSSTDLDELLNDYLRDPNDDNKKILQTKLQGREQELAEFNMNLILASLADSQGKTIDDVQITGIFYHRDEEHGKGIMLGQDNYEGHTLHVESLQGFQYNGKTNFTQIPREIFDLISDAKFQDVAPDSSYFEYDKNSKSERAIETYKEIKKAIKDKNLAIVNGKVCTVDVKHDNLIIAQEDDERDF